MTATMIEFEKVDGHYICDLTKYSDTMAGVINLITSEPNQIVSVEAGVPEIYPGDRLPTTDAYTAPDERTVYSDTPATLRVYSYDPLPRFTKIVVKSITTSTGEPLKLTIIEQMENAITVMADNHFAYNGATYVPSIPKGTILYIEDFEVAPMVVQTLQTPYGKGLVFELDFPDGVGVTLRTSKPVKQAIWLS